MGKERLSWSRSAESDSSASSVRGSSVDDRGASVQVGSAKAQRRVSNSTTISSGCGIKGELFFTGRSEINCRIEGEIASEGELVIGESAQISAGIRAERLVVFGAVNGDIVCSERIELHAGSRVRGSICSPRIAMHDGVHFEGDCVTPTTNTPEELSPAEDDERLGNE